MFNSYLAAIKFMEERDEYDEEDITKVTILSLLRHLDCEIRITHPCISDQVNLLVEENAKRSRMEDTKLDIKVIVQNRFVQNISSEQPQSFLKDEVEEMNLPQGWTTSLVGEHRYIVSPEGDLKRDFKQQNLQFDCLFAPGEIFKDLVAALAQMVKLGTAEGEVCSKSLVGFFLKTYKTSSAIVSG